jgi:hypothetical protein
MNSNTKPLKAMANLGAFLALMLVVVPNAFQGVSCIFRPRWPKPKTV